MDERRAARAIVAGWLLGIALAFSLDALGVVSGGTALFLIPVVGVPLACVLDTGRGRQAS